MVKDGHELLVKMLDNLENLMNDKSNSVYLENKTDRDNIKHLINRYSKSDKLHPIYEETKNKLQIFTTHSIVHSINIINKFDMILKNVCYASGSLAGVETEDDIKLSETEKIILLMSAVLHDYGMKDGVEYRAEHNYRTNDLIDKDLNDEAVLGDIESVLPGIINLVKSVCFAHTNDKHGNSPSLDYKTIVNLNEENVRLKLLSGILKFVDELDSDHNRNLSLSQNIDDYRNPSVIMGVESLSHWRTNELISTIDVIDNKIVLIIDDSTLEKTLNRKLNIYSEYHDFNIIKNRYQKIKKEFKYFRDEIISQYSNYLFKINDVEVKTSNKDLNRYLNEDSTGINNFLFNKANLIGESEGSIQTKDIQDEIEKEINKKNMLRQGHFEIDKIHSIRCRDWLNVSQLVTGDFLNDITKSILKQIYGIIEVRIEEKKSAIKEIDLWNATNIKELKEIYLTKESVREEVLNYVIVGIGINGIKIGSIISSILGIPFIYDIKDKKEDYHSIDEIFKENKNNKVIFITDMIVTGSSLRKSIDTFISQNKELETEKYANNDFAKQLYEHEYKKNLIVLTLFFRKSYDQVCTDILLKNLEVYRNNIYYFNDKFTLEICNKNPESCYYKNSKFSKIDCSNRFCYHSGEIISLPYNKLTWLY